MGFGESGGELEGFGDESWVLWRMRWWWWCCFESFNCMNGIYTTTARVSSRHHHRHVSSSWESCAKKVSVTAYRSCSSFWDPHVGRGISLLALCWKSVFYVDCFYFPGKKKQTREEGGLLLFFAFFSPNFWVCIFSRCGPKSYIRLCWRVSSISMKLLGWERERERHCQPRAWIVVETLAQTSSQVETSTTAVSWCLRGWDSFLPHLYPHRIIFWSIEVRGGAYWAFFVPSIAPLIHSIVESSSPMWETLVCPPPKLTFFRSSFMYSLLQAVSEDQDLQQFVKLMRRCRRGWDDVVLNLIPSVWPFWPTGLLFSFSFIVSVFLNDLMCASGIGFCNKQAPASKGREQQSGEPSKEIRGGWSSTIQRPQTTFRLKLHIWSCSLVSAHFLSSVDYISKFSFCLQNQWRNCHSTATSRARRRVGEGILWKLL